MALSKSVKSQCRELIRQGSEGLSLLEMALGMMILSILSVGVSSLIKSGVEAQLAQQLSQEAQTVGLNIVDDLRHDIRTADKAEVNGNQLVLSMPTGNTLTYQLVGGNFSRTDTAGGTKTYNTVNPSARLRVVCEPNCFRAELNDSNEVRQVIVDALRVEQIPQGTGGTIIDQQFGTANFTVRKFAFELLSATEFQ
ncbi:MAG TPA: hypothetical protein V6C99_09545 [Oculatellaceae cyanobacterium]|jgi:Tfp pilus assembly protein PilV